MGEAKRRRLAGKPPPVRSNGKVLKDGKLVDHLAVMRRTEQSLSEAHAEVVAGLMGDTARVPCDGCRECCWHHRVVVSPLHDQVDQLDTVCLDDGTTVLRQMPDGRCVHLGEGGCTVYEHRPKVCRKYDCRMLLMLGEREMFESGHAPPVWDFALKSREDRVLALALRHTGATNAGPDGTLNREDAVAGICVGYRKSMSQASVFVDQMDKLTPEEWQREVAIAQEYEKRLSRK